MQAEKKIDPLICKFFFFAPVVSFVRCAVAGREQTVALDHYGDLVDSMMSKFVAINSGVEKTVSGVSPKCVRQ